MASDEECAQRDGDAVCNRPPTNHRNCTGWDPVLGRYRDWPNPDHIPPANTTRSKAQAKQKTAVASTAPDTRVAGIEAGMAASASAARGWTDVERKAVFDAVFRVCQLRPGATFTADDIWDQLAGSVPVTKGLASVLQAAKREGICEPTDEHATARRGGEHDHGQTLRVWVSRINRIQDRSY